MRDLIGNRIEEGNLLWWQKLGTAVKVLRVTDGGLSLVGANGDRTPTPAMLTVELSFPIDVSKLPPGAEPQLGEFLRVVDPKSADILDRAMGGRKQ